MIAASNPTTNAHEACSSHWPASGHDVWDKNGPEKCARLGRHRQEYLCCTASTKTKQLPCKSKRMILALNQYWCAKKLQLVVLLHICRAARHCNFMTVYIDKQRSHARYTPKSSKNTFWHCGTYCMEDCLVPSLDACLHVRQSSIDLAMPQAQNIVLIPTHSCHCMSAHACMASIQQWPMASGNISARRRDKLFWRHL